jgi:putative endonuclease
MFYIYILECADKTYYTGYTNDLDARLKRHNEGLASKYTRSRLPVKLVWSKCCKSKSAAMRAEVKIKQLTRKEKEKLVNHSRVVSA